MDRKCGLSGRMPEFQEQSPKFKPQSHQNNNNNNNNNNNKIRTRKRDPKSDVHCSMQWLRACVIAEHLQYGMSPGLNFSLININAHSCMWPVATHGGWGR
jgi:hypothetical protein